MDAGLKRLGANSTGNEFAEGPAGERPRSDQPEALRRFGWRAAAMVAFAAVLALHGYLRIEVLRDRPTASLGALYPHSYSTALSMLAGHGFQRLPVSDDEASEPVRAFLDLERDGISRREFTNYLRSIPRQEDWDIGNYAVVDSTRILDLRVAAMVWKLFGISWYKLSIFYVVLSILACSAVMVAAFKITRSTGAALLAGLILACAPQEGVAGVYNMRDTNPLWFVAFSLAALFCLTRRSRPRWVDYCAFLGLGAVATVGIGWRADSLVLIPFCIVAATIRLRAAQAPWRCCIGAAACAVLGSVLVQTLIQQGSPLQRVASGNPFHVALHGGCARSNILGVENAHQLFFDDAKVAHDAFARLNAVHPGQPMEFSDEAYGKLCGAMYMDDLRYNAFHWLAGAPKIAKVILQGGPTPPQWPQTAVTVSRWLVYGSGLSTLLPILLAISFLALGDASFDRGGLLTVAVFLVIYSGVWFAVAPNQRHIGPLLVPLAILASVSLPVVTRLCGKLRSGEWRGLLSAARFRPLIKWSCAGAAGVAVLLCVSYFVSASDRAECLAELRTRAARAEDCSNRIRSSRRFLFADSDAGKPYAWGFLLKLDVGSQASELRCSHIWLTDHQIVTERSWRGGDDPQDVFHEIRKVLWWNSFGETRHRLEAEQEQYFFVSTSRTPPSGDDRRYRLQIEVGKGARIISAQRLDLSDWKRLPVSTVFAEGEGFGVSRPIGGVPTRSLIQFPATPEALMSLGFIRQKFH